MYALAQPGGLHRAALHRQDAHTAVKANGRARARYIGVAPAQGSDASRPTNGTNGATATPDVTAQASGLESFDNDSAFDTRPFSPMDETNEVEVLDPHDATIVWGEDTQLRNQIQLSTYPDCIGGNLNVLQSFVRSHLQGVVGGVHVLPFYPSSADRGFAPLTYKTVDPEFGDWSQIEAISDRLDLCVDFMVNHISQQSEEFQDFKKHGSKSKWADLFIRYDEFWGGEPTQEQLDLIYTRKPRPPYFEVTFADGTSEKVWCTFDHEQIDIDVRSPIGRAYILDQLDSLCDRGAKLIRLDAMGYTTKKRNTNCFFVEPDVWEILDDIKAHVEPKGVELLCEVHEHYSMQKLLASHDFWVYDFALPMLCLQGLYDGNSMNLKNWLAIAPRKQITTLDTHDGIGVVDVADLMTEEEIARTKQNMFDRGANMSMRYNSAQFGNLDIYQINCTYFAALGGKDAWYLLARAIQFFTPGIPLVYYVGLLVGGNDVELVERTKVGRDVNRHPYTLDEGINQLERPVVKALFELCRFRNSHPAFDGDLEVLEGVQSSYDDHMLYSSTSVDGDGTGTHVSGSQDASDSPLVDSRGSPLVQRMLTDTVDISKSGDSGDSPGPRGLKPLPGRRSRASTGPSPAFRTFSPAMQNADADAFRQSMYNDDSDPSQSPAQLRTHSRDMSRGMTRSELAAPKRPGSPPSSPWTALEQSKSASGSSRPARRNNGLGVQRPRGGDSPGNSSVRSGSSPRARAGSPASRASSASARSASPYFIADGQAQTPAVSKIGADLRSAKPHESLVMKWTNGDSYAVLEANMASKVFRIVYLDPLDNSQKVLVYDESTSGLAKAAR